MQDSRERFLEVQKKYMPAGPGSDKYWAPEIECAPRSKFQEMQSERLETAFRYIYEYSAFFHEKYKKANLTPADIKSIDDLHKIPITTRQELIDNQKEHPPFGTWQPIDDIWTKRGWVTFFTSGTSGRPLVVRKTDNSRIYMQWSLSAIAWGAGGRPGDIAMICLPYTHVFSWDQHMGATGVGMPVIVAGPPLPTEARIQRLLDYKPTWIVGTPSYMLRFAEALREKGIDPASTSARVLACGGEPGSLLSTKRRVEEAWGGKARMGDFAGTTEEAMGIAQACSDEMNQLDHDMRTHLQEHHSVTEVVDEHTMEPVPEGQKGILLFSFFAEESSIIPRYLVGDYMVVDSTPCSCGRTTRRAVGGLQGRSDDRINIRGLKIHPTDIDRVVRPMEELSPEYKLIVSEVRGMSELVIRVEAKPEISIDRYASIAEKVAHGVKVLTEIRPTVDVLPPGSLEKPEFKAKRVERVN